MNKLFIIVSTTIRGFFEMVGLFLVFMSIVCKDMTSGKSPMYEFIEHMVKNNGVFWTIVCLGVLLVFGYGLKSSLDGDMYRGISND